MAIDASAYPIEFRLLPVTRRGYIFGGVTFLISGLVCASVSALVFPSGLILGLFLLVMGSAASLYGVIGLVRWPRMSLTMTESDVLVRGMFGSRRIARDRIVGIGAYPTIRWTDDRGRTRSTAVNVLNIYQRSVVMPDILRNNARQVATLTEWASEKS